MQLGPIYGQDTFTYDNARRVLTAIKGRYSNTVTFTYENGRKLTEALTLLGQTYTVTSGYDAAGRENSLTYPDGTHVTRTHTNRGQLASVNLADPQGNVAGSPVGPASSVSTFSYDEGGRETSLTYDNGGFRPHARLARRNSVEARRGFVLLLVLATLVIAAMLTAGVARLSLIAALDAIRAEEQFQQRWVRRGLQETLLGQAERVLSEANLIRPGTASVEGTLRLNDVEYRFEVADESAKANLNSVAKVRGVAAVRPLVGKLSRAAGRLTVELHPFDEADVAFDSWGQVFDVSAEDDAHECADAIREATSHLTCWGSGPLNLRRASDDIIRAYCESIAPGVKIEGLLGENRETLATSVADRLASARVGTDDAERLQPWIGTSSSCWSLWLQPSAASGSAVEFHVMELTPSGRPDLMVFRW